MIEPEVPKPTLRELHVVDPPAAWEALGFVVVDDAIALDGVVLRLGASTPALAIDGIPPIATLDGLAMTSGRVPPPEPPPHPNGVTGVEHFVIVSPDFDRTVAALDAAGLPLKRIQDTEGFRQGFRRIGAGILELVEANQMAYGPARLWGITLIVSDLEALAARLGDRLRRIKDAVQPGWRIATLDRSAGLRTYIAFMSRKPAT